MENNNGRGIFYGVMGVATLVVAIVGATFAYFAASTNGTTGGVAANSANVAGTIKLTEKPDVRTNLLPTTEEFMKTSFAQEGTTGERDGKCNGVNKADGVTVFDLCSTYEYTVSNEASVDQTVYMTLTVVKNDFKHLKYCVYEGSTTAATKLACKDALTSGPEDLGSVLVPAGGNHTYTVVLFVNETGTEQTTDDSGKSFTATVSASTSDGTNNVTGVIAS